jgi:hypothetical protein
MNVLDRTLRARLVCHAGSQGGGTSLLTGRAQGIRIASLQTQTDIGQPIQVVPKELLVSSGSFPCVPSNRLST